MVYLLAISLLLLVSFCDSQRFANKLIEENQVWANDSGPALFKWRYTPQNTDVPSSATIDCYYEEKDSDTTNKVYVIKREEGQNPVPQNTPRLGNRVTGYVDSNDPTIFGFIITRVRKSDPKKYECLAAYNLRSDGKASAEESQRLTLQVVDPPELSRCLNNVQQVKYDSTLTIECYAPGNPVPNVACELWGENDTVLQRLGSKPENFTDVYRGEDTLLKLRKIVCFITADKTGSYNKTTTGKNQVLIFRPPFPPKNVSRFYPDDASATSVYLRWVPIPVAEQGGGLNDYEISYWVNGQRREINKTDVSVGTTADTDGYISHGIQNLQPTVEYKFLVYGKNEYSSDSIPLAYYSTEYIAVPSDRPPTSTPSTSNKNTGAIIGGVIGGVVFIIIVIVLVVYCTRRDDKQKHFPTSYVDDVVDYPPAKGGHQLYSTVEKKRLPSHDDDSTSGYPDIISTTQNGDYGNQMRSKSSSSFEPSSKVYL